VSNEEVLSFAPVDVSPAGLHVVGARPWVAGVVKKLAPQARVEHVEVTAMTVGTTTRLALHVAHDGPDNLPRRWFIKLPSLSWRARAITALPRLLSVEARVYRQLDAHWPVPVPQCLATGLSWRGNVVVLGDVAEQGASACATGESINNEQAYAVVNTLAALHARFWNTPELDGPLAWLGPALRRREDRLGSLLATPLMRAGLKAAGSRIPGELIPGLLHFARNRRRVMSTLCDGPRTLVHHDCHPGNLFFGSTGAGLLDWQMVRIGNPVGDLAYLLATALTPEQCVREQEGLIDHYVTMLARLGVEDVSLAWVREQVSLHLVRALEAMLVTAGIGGLMPDDAAMTYIERAVAAVAINDTLDRVQAI
jgi:aminoglycoside phosphotransferase (APT) family kinase protein